MAPARGQDIIAAAIENRAREVGIAILNREARVPTLTLTLTTIYGLGFRGPRLGV